VRLLTSGEDGRGGRNQREAAPAVLAAGGIFMHGGGVAATPQPQEVAAGVQLRSGKLPASTSAPVTTSSGGTTRRSLAPLAEVALCGGRRGTQARKQRGGVLRTRSAGDRVVPGSDAKRQHGAGGMPPDSGESGSGTRRTVAPDGPARRARGWAWGGRGPETRAGPRENEGD
jgi:hypothetical protein